MLRIVNILQAQLSVYNTAHLSELLVYIQVKSATIRTLVHIMLIVHRSQQLTRHWHRTAQPREFQRTYIVYVVLFVCLYGLTARTCDSTVLSCP